MNDDKRPVGVFDSGVGGLCVLKYAARILPNESFIYYGDTKNAPYGNKPEAEIRDLTLSCGEYLFSRGAKAMVIACNTATSAAVKIMREKYNIPVVSIEPAVKPAIAAGDGMVVVLATPATIAQRRYRALVERLGCEKRVINIPCGELASLVERCDEDDPRITAYLRGKFNPLIGEHITGIVLGCTHYTFVANSVAEAAKDVLGNGIELFDGTAGTARQLKRVLSERGIAAGLAEKGSVELVSSAGADAAARMWDVYNRNIPFLEK